MHGIQAGFPSGFCKNQGSKRTEQASKPENYSQNGQSGKFLS
jgi:hypothetical protein